jgi:hypothetical protein
MSAVVLANTAAWLAARVGCVGASRINDVLDVRKDGKPGAGRKRYLAELVAERLTGSACDHVVTAPMVRGRDKQPDACAAYEAATGNIVGPEAWYPHPSIMYAGCTPDGTIDDDGLVEFKVPLAHNFVDWKLDGGIPEQHVAQLTWQIAVTRRQWVDFVAFCPEIQGAAGLHIVRFAPKAEDVDAMETKVREFLAQVDAAFEQLTTTEPA